MKTMDETAATPPPAPAAPPAGYPGRRDDGYGYGSGSDAPGPGVLSVSRLFRVARRKWWILLVAAGLAGTAAHLHVRRSPRFYKATCLVEMSIRRPRIVSQQGAVIEDPTQGTEETLNTRIEKLRRGGQLLAHAMTAYRAARPEDPTTDRVLSNLLRNVSFELMRRTRLVSISVSHTDPQFAADACNAYAAATESLAREENRGTSDAAVGWLQAQAELQRKEVEAREADILAFRKANQMDAIESQHRSANEALVSLSQDLMTLESREAQERELRDTLQKLKPTPETVGTLPAMAPRADEIRTAIEKWMAEQTAYTSRLTRYTPEHPDVINQAKLVGLLRHQAEQALDRARTTSEANLQLLQRQIASLQKSRTTQQKLCGDLELRIAERQTQLAGLERARDASDNAFRGLLARIQEARLAADENTATVKIASTALVPTSPFSPFRTQLVNLAILLGALIGFALALALDWMEDFVASPDEIEDGFALPVLAVIPHVSGTSRADLARVAVADAQGAVAEAFAGLRSILDSPNYRQTAKTLLVVSALPGEGKTVTACNLASAFARGGQRTLLIDFDLHRPRISSVFPMPEGSLHLAATLPDESVPFERMVYPGGLEGLSILGGSPGKARIPVDLIVGPRAQELFLWARANFDRIVVDAPPVAIVSDSLVLAGLCDMTLLVVRLDKGRRKAVADALRRLREVGASAVAFVANDLRPSRFHYGTPYYYYAQAGRRYRERGVVAKGAVSHP